MREVAGFVRGELRRVEKVVVGYWRSREGEARTVKKMEREKKDMEENEETLIQQLEEVGMAL